MLQEIDSKPSIPVFVGILVGLLASFVQSLGLTIQRKSHIQNDLKSLDRRKKAHRRPLWLLGFAIFISSNLLGTVFQIGALPIVILAPLGAVSLLWNALLCRFLLGEHFSTSTLFGTFFIATGAVLIAVFGVVPEQNHSLDELLDLFARPAFVAYFTLMGVAVLAVLATSHLVEFGIRSSIKRSAIRLGSTPDQSPAPSLYEPPSTEHPAIPFRVTRGSRRWSAPSTPPTIPGTLPALSLGDEHPIRPVGEDGNPDGIDKTPARSRKHVTILLPSYHRPSSESLPLLETPPGQPSPTQQKTLILLGMAFAAASGTLSGMCLLLAKCAVELLILTFASKGADNQFKHFKSWALVAGLGLAALAQLFYLNHSLRLAGPALICPLAFCFYNISSIFDGLVFYSQFSELRPYQIVLVTVGIAVLLLGVWSVSAIEPSGIGGVEVNGWADDSMLEADDDGQPLLERPYSDEPESALISEAPTNLPVEGVTFPLSPAAGSLPTSPISPIFRRRKSDRGRRSSIQARFGTLIPDLTPAGVPAGFSIGLNTSSPGFVLRSVEHGADETSPVGLGLGHFRPRSWSGSAIGRSPLQDGSSSPRNVNEATSPASKTSSLPEVERHSWMSWWKTKLHMGKREGKVRLPLDQ